MTRPYTCVHVQPQLPKLYNMQLSCVLLAMQIDELTAASTFAGLSSLGSASMDMTLMRMVSTVWIGSHRSSGFS